LLNISEVYAAAFESSAPVERGDATAACETRHGGIIVHVLNQTDSKMHCYLAVDSVNRLYPINAVGIMSKVLLG